MIKEIHEHLVIIRNAIDDDYYKDLIKEYSTLHYLTVICYEEINISYRLMLKWKF